MDAVKIAGANLVLGKPTDWEATNGECGSLHANREVINGMTITTSEWRPSPDELTALNNGAGVYLTVWGHAHPPVCVWVRDEQDIQLAT